MKNYYQILEVSKDASQEEIKRAYRGLAKKYHPDKTSYEGADKLFAAINEAYEVLGDPDKRRQHDDYEEAKNSTYRPQQRQYRSRPNYRPSSSSQVDVTPYVRYFRTINLVALIFSIILTMDYLIPRKQDVETVEGAYTVWGQTRRGTRYKIATEIHTDKGLFRIRSGFKGGINRGDLLYIDRSVFLNLATAISLGTSEQSEKQYLKGNIYYNFSFALIAMIGTALLGVRKKISPMNQLNFAIVNGILILLVMYFIKVS